MVDILINLIEERSITRRVSYGVVILTAFVVLNLFASLCQLQIHGSPLAPPRSNAAGATIVSVIQYPACTLKSDSIGRFIRMLKHAASMSAVVSSGRLDFSPVREFAAIRLLHVQISSSYNSQRSAVVMLN